MNHRAPKEQLRQRLSAIGNIFIIFFILLSVRLWYLQAMRGVEYKALSQKNSIRLIRLRNPRGEIMDRNGKILIRNRPSFNLLIFRSEKKEENEKYQDALFSALGIDKKLSDFSLGIFTPLKEDITWEKVVWVEERKCDLPEVSIEVEPKRYYPHGRIASHILGYVGEVSQEEIKQLTHYNYNQGDIIGKSGVEKTFERWLKGKDGGKQLLVDARGYQVDVLGCKEPLPGNNIRLTIDYRIQKIVEDAIGEKRGAIVVMDPRNGEVLAMASRPDFDPNIFTKPISSEDWKKLTRTGKAVFANRATQGEYPPGSVFKLVVAIAALEEGLIGINDKLSCGGSYTVGNRTFRCWQEKGHGAFDINEGIVNSCDVFFYQLGRRVGAERIAYYARKLGLNSPTHIDLPGEKAGLIPTPRWKKRKLRESWYRGDTTNMSIGQGYVLTTPLQMANAYCTIANGGTLYKPRLLKAIVTSEGTVITKTAPKILRELNLKPQTKEILRKAFTEVVSRGTGQRAKVEGTKVAGKTGTSENPHGDDHAWFIGFAPADSPEICVAVLFENAGHGSTASAPVCGKIIRKAMQLK